ncbi:MAG: hypothetical protein ACKOCT_14755, partial [Alphaproteobacteria bacterium]
PLPWLAVLVTGALATLPWTVQRHWDAKPDAATYLLAARSLANGEGYRVLGEPFTLRPPGWSALLAPLVAWRGFDFAAINLEGGLFGVLAIALLFLLLRPRLGDPVACAVAGATWLAPRYQQLCNQVLSDVPGFAAALAALLAIRAAVERPSVVRDVVAALAIGASCWVRTANLLLVPTLALARTFRPSHGGGSVPARLAAALPACALAAALYLPWALVPDAPISWGGDALQSYATALLRVDPVDPSSPLVGPAEAASRVARNALSYAALLGSSNGTRPTGKALVLASLGLLAWLVVLVRRREAPEWFAGLTALLVVAYYVAQARLALVPATIAFAAVAEVARGLVRRVAPAVAGDAAVVALVAAAALAMRLGGAGPVRARSAARAADLDLVAAHLRATGSPGDRLGADFGTVWALLLDRPVEGLQSICNRLGPDAARARIAERGLDRLVLQSDGACRALLDLGEEELRQGSVVVRRLRPVTPGDG